MRDIDLTQYTCTTTRVRMTDITVGRTVSGIKIIGVVHSMGWTILHFEGGHQDRVLSTWFYLLDTHAVTAAMNAPATDAENVIERARSARDEAQAKAEIDAWRARDYDAR